MSPCLLVCSKEAAPNSTPQHHLSPCFFILQPQAFSITMTLGKMLFLRKTWLWAARNERLTCTLWKGNLPSHQIRSAEWVWAGGSEAPPQEPGVSHLTRLRLEVMLCVSGLNTTWDGQPDPRTWPGPLPGFIRRIYGITSVGISFIEYRWLYLDQNIYE